MSEQLEYTIKRSASGYVVSGPALSSPCEFDSEARARSLVETLIGGKGGYITANGRRFFYKNQGHLQSGAISR